MKKGLLSILASALLVVGCQNYDDQFTSIENSINSLQTQVAGLSDVSAQLTSLSSTVQSLSTTVSSLPSSSEIATQISTGLAGIIEDVADLEAAVAAADSSEAVASIQADIDAQEETLAELLANSSVFTGPVTINSVATLDAFYQMRTGLSIVNGAVTITVSTEMDQTKVQAVVDEMLTIIGDLTYTSKASSIAETTFDKLTGVTNIDIEQAGGYRFPVLLAATDVTLGSNFESTVAVIDFRSATSIGSFHTDSTTSTIEFTKATELHLTALERYDTSSSVPLKLIIDEGGALPITALDDVDTDGDQEDIYLEITGPTAVTIENFEDGSLTFTDVPTVVVNNFLGTIITSTGVESLSANSVVGSITLGTDLETIDITGVLDVDDEDDTGVAIAITSDSSDLENLTVAGDVASLSVTAADKLTTAVISADVDGAITFTDNDDLVTLTLTDSEADSVSITDNDSLVTLTVDTTNSEDDGSLVITGNTDLESLTVTYDEVETLTITGNTSLETVDLSGITAVGAAGAPVVNIYSNDLTATSSVDEEDTTATDDGAAATDLGEFTTASGLDTAAAYLALVAADADSSAAVFFDTVESYTDEAEEEFTDVEFATALLTADEDSQNATTVLLKVANTADTGDDATQAKRSFLFPVNATNINSINVNNTSILLDGDKSTQGKAEQLFLGTTALANADAAGVTMTYALNASPQAKITIDNNSNASENSYTGAANTVVANDLNFGVSDSFTLTVDGLAATITYTHVAAAGFATNAATIAHALAKEWNDSYVGTTSANLVRWSLVTNTAPDAGVAGAAAVIDIIAKDRGSRDIGAAMSASYSLGKTSTDSDVGFVIGNVNTNTISAADNIAQGSYVMVTFEADTAGDLLGEIRTAGNVPAAAGAISIHATGLVELTSTYAPQATASNATTATNIYPNESRLDVIIPEEAVDAATSNAVSYTRVGWL